MYISPAYESVLILIVIIIVLARIIDKIAVVLARKYLTRDNLALGVARARIESNIVHGPKSSSYNIIRGSIRALGPMSGYP